MNELIWFYFNLPIEVINRLLNMKRSTYKLISHRNEFVIDKALSQVKKMVNALRMPHMTGVTRCKFSSPDVNITAKPCLKDTSRFYGATLQQMSPLERNCLEEQKSGRFNKI